ncbi:MAG TPA: DUF169 domain-containing protein [Dehalococcoidia bacterium]|nr:DUF169 domain-containing protein [Dehalococcoidia bacterium]
MNGREVAQRLTDALGLETPPVALRFAEAAPAGVPEPAADVPSACSFWRTAEQGVFFAPAAAHYHCPIGAVTMGFDLPEGVQQELMAAVGLMNEAEYLSPAEPAQIPSTGKGAAGIVYGPLAAFPLDPDLVLLWLTPRQAMLVNEAAGGARWTAEPLTVRGRPACAALPLALSGERATLSLGCMGMRTFTEIADDRLLIVLPGEQAGALAESLQAVAQANARMQQYYLQKRAAFAP